MFGNVVCTPTGSGEVILGMDEMQYSAQHQGGWNEGVVSVEGTGLTEHRRFVDSQ